MPRSHSFTIMEQIFPLWEPRTDYAKGQYVVHDGWRYVVTGETSQEAEPGLMDGGEPWLLVGQPEPLSR